METPEDELCFPLLLNSSCRKKKHPLSETMLLYTLLCFISLLTMCLNLLVIISISHFRQLHTPTNLLLLSLALADFLVGLLLVPLEGMQLVEACWYLGPVMCALSYMIGYILISVSVGSMVLISMDRYVAICDPLRYPYKITLKKVKISVCLCWICSVVFNWLILKEHLQQPGKLNSCYGECIVVMNSVSGTIDLVFTFIGPCSVIIILYMRVFVVAVSQARAMQSHVTAVAPGKLTVTAKRSERKAARTLGIMIAVFLMCFCPFYYTPLSGQDTINGLLSWTIVSWLVYFNSCMNPLIYAYFYPWFRKAIKMIVTLQIIEPNSCKARLI